MRKQKKTLLSRIIVVAIAAVMVLGIVLSAAMSASAAEAEGVSVYVSAFKSSKLSAAIEKELDGISSDLITSLTVSDGTLTEADFHTIKSLKGLKYVDLSGCTAQNNEITAHAFSENTSLEVFIFPQNIKKIGSNAFSDCTALSDITLPDTLTEIGEYAFKNCKSLNSIDMPDSVTVLSEGAFYASGISSVTLPLSLEVIPKNCFNSCGNLSEVTIPANVTKIEGWAFADCSALKELVLEPMNAPEIGSDALPFDNDIYIMPNAVGYDSGDWLVYYITGEYYDGITAPIERPDTSSVSSDEPDDISDTSDSSENNKPDESSVGDDTASSKPYEDDTSVDTSSDESEYISGALVKSENEGNEKPDSFAFITVLCVLGVLIVGRLLMAFFNKIDDLSED